MKFHHMTKCDGTVILTHITEPDPLIRIPPFIDDRPVTEIGTDLIQLGVRTIPREIILPHTLKKIQRKAFYDLRYLKALYLPTGLQEIDDFGIFTCPDLTTLTVPSSVKILGTCAVGYMYEHGRAYRLNYFTLLCEKNSSAQLFAEENDLNYQLLP